MIIHMLNRMALKQIQAWYLGFMMMWIVEEVEVEVVVMLQDGHGRKMETGCVQIQGLWFDNARPAGAGGTGAVGGRGRGHGGGDTGERACHVGGSMGLFGSNDWPCPMMMGKYMMNLATLRRNSMQKHNRLNLDRWFLVLDVLDGRLMR
nr:PREDICTED: uncharacterized protein LOC103996489 isoform X2 [Musa acuminata subsp. malaccensis]